jgi:hypothetical protein
MNLAIKNVRKTKQRKCGWISQSVCGSSPVTVSARYRRHELSSPDRTLGAWVRIPIETWMSVCVYSVCAVLFVDCCLATGCSPVQGVLPTVKKKIKKLRKRSGLNKGMYSSWWMNEWMCWMCWSLGEWLSIITDTGGIILRTANFNNNYNNNNKLKQS